MTVTLSEVVAALQKMAPLSLAESWDNVGLLMEPDCGVQRSPVRRVFLTNDLTEDVLAEAETVNADLIVSYHPPVFAPFKRITSDAWKSRIVSRCLSQGIAVYSPHTSWDAVENGLTDWLISCFDGTVTPIVPLKMNSEFSHIGTLMFPKNDENKLIRKILSDQFLGENKDFKILNQNESHIQLLCKSSGVSWLSKVAKSHGIHMYLNQIESFSSSSTTAGAGRICQLKNEQTINAVIQNVKAHLGVNNLMVALAKESTMESTINSAAAVAGSGASLLRGVKVNLYLTGEMSHHDVLDAVHNNITVILANHSNTERNYLKVFADRLSGEMPQLDVCVSKVDKDPLIFV